jgi:DNA-binding CsgD family transcriptional regulator
MPSESSVVDRIYEAAIVPELWPTAIEAVAEHTGCYGGAFFSAGPHGSVFSASKTCEPHLNALVEGGWSERNIRVQRLVVKEWAGFVTDSDLCTDEEIANHPIYTQFLRPRGLGWSVATHIVGADDDIAIFSIDQSYDKGPVSEEVRSYLDSTRPHIARAAMLAAQFRTERIQGSLTSLELLGIPAVAVDRRGKVRFANEHFPGVYPAAKITAFDILDIGDDVARPLFRQALATIYMDHAPRSIPIPGEDGTSPSVIHIIPIKRQARDIFSSADAIVAFVPLSFPGLPFSALVKRLYDLTHSEAKIAEALISGMTVQAIARQRGITVETVRSHVKKVLGKTGVGRQADLIIRFSGFRSVREPA